MPGRPDVQKLLEDEGAKVHRIGGMNAWPVDILQKRDVYTCDHFGLKEGGPSIGDNVGNAIYAKSGNGIVYDGAVRDINGLDELPDFVAFVRAYDPSHHYGSLRTGRLLNSTMVSINAPTRIGHVMVMPGDVVLGRNGGVMFIPPHLAEQVVKYSERTHLEDMFGHQRLREKKYTAGQIDAKWTPEIEQDFHKWLKQPTVPQLWIINGKSWRQLSIHQLRETKTARSISAKYRKDALWRTSGSERMAITAHLQIGHISKN